MAGTFTYTPDTATLLNAGSGQTLSVAFTPADTGNYAAASATVSINVLKAMPVVTWSSPADMTFPATLGAAQFNAFASVPGSFAYSPPLGATLAAGTGQTLSVQFTPADAANYAKPAPKTVTVNVRKATPVIAWPAPADIVAGTALNAAQLNATVSVPGTFAYDPPAGSVLATGSQALSVQFTPNDSANYNAANAGVTIKVLIGEPPRIGSALTVTAAQSQAFAYKIVASGMTPMFFNATNLPAGLSLSGDTITGVPTGSGQVAIGIAATNAAGTDFKTLILTIASAAGTNSTAPVFASPPSTPAPAAAGQPVTFTAAGADAGGDMLLYRWDFGDGTTGMGPAVTHAYAVPGIYTATVTISDGFNAATQSVNVAINTSNSAASSTGGGAGSLPNAFDVLKASVKFSLKDAGKDSLILAGTIPLEPNFRPLGKAVEIVLGDLERRVVLDAKGRGGDSINSFKLADKLKDGAFAATPAKFLLALKKQTLFGQLEDLGFKNANVLSDQIALPVIIAIDNVSYLDLVTVTYTAKAGQSGSAKK